jgi:hypothetical protein
VCPTSSLDAERRGRFITQTSKELLSSRPQYIHLSRPESLEQNAAFGYKLCCVQVIYKYYQVEWYNHKVLYFHVGNVLLESQAGHCLL